MDITALDVGKEELAKSNPPSLSLEKERGVCTILAREKLDQSLL